MFVVHALYSSTYDKIYIGFTDNMEERFKSHNELAKKGWTIKFRPWEIIYQQHHLEKADAMRREKELKTATGRNFIKSLVNAKV
jgi:putative endonuclease